MLRAELLLRPRRSPHSLLTTYSRLTYGLLTAHSPRSQLLTTRCASCAAGGGARHTCSRAGGRSATPTTATCRCLGCATRRTAEQTTRARATATAAYRERPAPPGTAPPLASASPPRGRRSRLRPRSSLSNSTVSMDPISPYLSVVCLSIYRGGSGHWTPRNTAVRADYVL